MRTSLLVFLLLAGCTGSNEDTHGNGQDQPAPTAAASAIADIFRIDRELGTIRNHAPETQSMRETVRGYVAGLDALDFSRCPEDFVAAFTQHRDAWEASIEFFAKHDELRGEMHQLFEQIRGLDASTRAALERVEKRIWDTWGLVEDAARKHGAMPLETDH